MESWNSLSNKQQKRITNRLYPWYTSDFDPSYLKETTNKPYLVSVKISNNGSNYSMTPMNYKDRFRKHKMYIGWDDMKNLLQKIGVTDNVTKPKSVMNQTYDEMMDGIDSGEQTTINVWSTKYPMEEYMATEESFQEITLNRDYIIEGDIVSKGTTVKIKETDDIKVMTFVVKSVGRKWIKATSEWKDYKLDWDVEINEISSEWESNNTYTVTAKTEIDRSKYGTKRKAFPISAEQKKDIEQDTQLQNYRKEINRWIGYIEKNIGQYWYKKGEEKVLFFMKNIPEEEKKEIKNRLDTLKNTFEKNNAEKEIDRWLGYVKDNLKEYWYKKGVEKVRYFAKVIGETDKYEKILGELYDEFNRNNQPSEPKKSNAPSINISWNYQNYYEGKILLYKGQIIKITKITRENYGLENAMSFGGNEDGYLITAYYEMASKQEIIDFKREQTKKNDYNKKVGIIKQYFSKERFTVPNKVKQFNDDEVYSLIGEGHNIYGSGTAYAIDPNKKYIFEIVNNGMDGDDWSRNNYRTGGAGAIAKEFRYDEDIASLIKEIGVKSMTLVKE